MTLGVLARAARLYPVELHAFAFLSNHFHLLVSVPNAQRLASFMNYLNSNLAREAGRLIRWREKFWGRRYLAILVSNEEAAQIERFRYVLAHGVKEGLVGSLRDWPGAHCARALLDGEVVSGRWVDRTLEQAALRKRTAVVPGAFVTMETLRLAPLPCWRDLAAHQIRNRVRELAEEIEREGRIRAQHSGEAPRGRDFVFRQDPRYETNPIKKSPAPLAHVASWSARETLREAYRIFLCAYRHAAARLRAGALDVLFPEGAFPPALPIRTAPG